MTGVNKRYTYAVLLIPMFFYQCFGSVSFNAQDQSGRNTTSCDPNPCFEQRECTITGNVIQCESCPIGYSGDGITCSDINECILSTDNCNSNATCTNTEGSFSCACSNGYSGDGITCSDINECILSTDNCDSNATCTNTEGSFSCACSNGYSGDGITCSDINECSTDNGGCGELSNCNNTQGGHICSTCPTGYAGDGNTCTDINECAANNGGCSNNATCTNTEGSFSCACNNGYSGNGTTCNDIDECTLHTDNCDTNATCTNTGGSFSCACNAGYSGDGLTCTDINECDTDNGDCGALPCINFAGYHRCGYVFGHLPTSPADLDGNCSDICATVSLACDGYGQVWGDCGQTNLGDASCGSADFFLYNSAGSTCSNVWNDNEDGINTTTACTGNNYNTNLYACCKCKEP